MVESAKKGGFSEANKAKEKLMGKKKKKAKSIFALLPDNYVFSSPPAKAAKLTQDDTVICIMKKDWSKIPERYGPQLRSMDYKKHSGLQKSANQMNQTLSTQGSGSHTSGFALANASATMNTTANSAMVPADQTGTTSLMTSAHHPPQQQAV